MLEGGRKYTLMWATNVMLAMAFVGAIIVLKSDAQLFLNFLVMWVPFTVSAYGLFMGGNVFEHKYENGKKE